MFRDAIGSATADVDQISLISQSGFHAQANAAASVSTFGDASAAEAFAVSVFIADFSVTETATFDIDASINWLGDQLIGVKLRKTSGGDLFVLEGDGLGGSASDSATVTLEPGIHYEVFGMAVGLISVEGPGAEAQFAAGYTLNLVPIPAPASAAPLLAGLLAYTRRRSRANTSFARLSHSRSRISANRA